MSSTTEETFDLEEKNLNRRDVVSVEKKIPNYAYPENISFRYRILANLPLTQDMTAVFNEICDYIQKENNESPIVSVDHFLEYISSKKFTKKIFHKETVKTILKKLIEILNDEDIQLIEVLKEDDHEYPQTFIIKDYRNVNFKNVLQLQKCLEDIFKQIEVKKSSFPNLKQVADQIRWDADSILQLSTEIDIEEITLKKLLQSSTKKNYVATIIKLPDELKEVVIPNSSMSKLVYFLVDMIKNFYENDENRYINQTIEKKIKAQSLDPESIHDVLTNIKIQDTSFLNFSQIFYSVMVDLHQRLRSSMNDTDIVIRNNLIASIIVSKLSLNRRKEIRTEQKKQDEKTIHFKTIYHHIISRFITTHYKKKMFYPTTLEEIKKLEVTLGSENKEPIITSIEAHYQEGEILNYIKELNQGENSIPEIIILQEQNQGFYLHRCRLITTFFSLLDEERSRITALILEKWRNNSRVILKHGQKEEFYLLVEENISSFFSNFHKTMIHYLNLPTTGSIEEMNYFLNRLFFSENEMLKLENIAPDLKTQGDDQKRKILKLFLETILTSKNQIRKKYDILQIPFSSLIEESLKKGEISFVGRLLFYLSEIWYEISKLINLEKKRTGKKFQKKNQLMVEKGINKLINYGEKIGQKIIQTKNQVQSQSTQSSIPKNLSPSASSSNKNQNKLNELKKLKNDLPILANPEKIKQLLAEELDHWNLKIGEARQQQTDYVNDLAHKMYQKIDTSDLKENNADNLLNTVIKNNHHLNEISQKSSKDSLKKYLFYLIALLKYQQLKK